MSERPDEDYYEDVREAVLATLQILKGFRADRAMLAVCAVALNIICTFPPGKDRKRAERAMLRTIQDMCRGEERKYD